MTYDDAIHYLYDLQWFGLKLGLENTRRLAALAGNPQDRLRFIHVAGTNGKGSTCAMLESIYRHAGYRVGLFTSPHLVSFRERLQVNREFVGRDDVVGWVEFLQARLAGFPRDHSPTFFEVVTVMALCQFAEQQCDVVIWETGLGGRLDATNIVTPLASVITNIQFDHEKWLGATLARIAAEKAGIIKPGVPVVTATDAPEALAVIRAAAQLNGSPLVEVTSAALHQPPLEELSLPLLGEHQRFNAATALATVRVLAPILPVPETAPRAGLSAVNWAGRLQTLTDAAGRLTLLDGAHNPAAVRTLEAAIQRHFPGSRPTLILGVLRDKDWSAMCHQIAPLVEAIYLVPVASARSALPDELRHACQTTAPGVPVHLCGSLEEALRRTETLPFRLITGSLYLVGEALERLGALTTPQERGLNEWHTGPSAP